MRRLILIVAALIVSASAASAAVLYSNGPTSGNTEAQSITGLAVQSGEVADSFYLPSLSVLTGVDFTVWTSTGLLTEHIDWALLDASPEVGGNVLFSGTSVVSDAFLFVNTSAFDVNNDSIVLPNVSLNAGTYWLALQNADVTTHNPNKEAFWDINGGPSLAWSSESGGVSMTPCSMDISPTGWCSNTFDILGTTSVPVPEPGTLSVFVFGLVAVARRRRRATSTPIFNSCFRSGAEASASRHQQ